MIICSSATAQLRRTCSPIPRPLPVNCRKASFFSVCNGEKLGDEATGPSMRMPGLSNCITLLQLTIYSMCTYHGIREQIYIHRVAYSYLYCCGPTPVMYTHLCVYVRCMGLGLICVHVHVHAIYMYMYSTCTCTNFLRASSL